MGRNNRAFPLWLTTGYGYSRTVLPPGYPFFGARYRRVLPPWLPPASRSDHFNCLIPDLWER